MLIHLVTIPYAKVRQFIVALDIGRQQHPGITQVHDITPWDMPHYDYFFQDATLGGWERRLWRMWATRIVNFALPFLRLSFYWWPRKGPSKKILDTLDNSVRI